ncbi:MAG: Crp/Fnr family transcriptional regulator [Candidatus Bipolaricaulia bacterium]
MAEQNRFWCIEHLDLSEFLTQAERDQMHQLMKFVEYKAGETIFFPGDSSDTVYLIRKGKVRLAYLDESGKRLTLSIVGRGQVFGETALAAEEQRKWIAEAMEDATLCIMYKKDFLRFAAGNPKFSLSISAMIGSRLEEIENKIEDLIFKDVTTRLCRTLLNLARDYGEESANGIKIGLKLTHQELAYLIGSTRETTSLKLNELEHMDVLEKGRGKIVIKDEEKLRELADAF